MLIVESCILRNACHQLLALRRSRSCFRSTVSEQTRPGNESLPCSPYNANGNEEIKMEGGERELTHRLYEIGDRKKFSEKRKKNYGGAVHTTLVPSETISP